MLFMGVFSDARLKPSKDQSFNFFIASLTYKGSTIARRGAAHCGQGTNA